MGKKNILFVANGDKGWIGGLYYIKNMIYSILNNPDNLEKINIFILLKKENKYVFESFLTHKNVEIIEFTDSKINNYVKKFPGRVAKRMVDLQMLGFCRKYHIDYIYPCMGYPYLGLESKSIHWIPDFQHLYMPELFLQSELKLRNRKYKSLSKMRNKLILSSKDALEDYHKLYPDSVEEIHVVPFVSDIEDEIHNISGDSISAVLQKYNLPQKYIYMPNQFWAHKNHITAYKAMKNLVRDRELDITLVCTGNTSDYRNKNHFTMLKKFIDENNLGENIKILGFISRVEQLSIMKQASLIIQPSLCEGWGTVVEDAKALDKTIILSDIKVHYEQANSKCIIFDKSNPEELAEIISQYIDKNDLGDVEEGLNYIRKTSRIYSEELFKVFQL